MERGSGLAFPKRRRVDHGGVCGCVEDVMAEALWLKRSLQWWVPAADGGGSEVEAGCAGVFG